MTVGDFINWVTLHPMYSVAFAVLMPVMAWWIGWMAGDRAEENPWRSVYSVIIYAVCIPGIFALTLSLASFLFGKGDIYNVDLLVQVLPLLVMFITIMIVRRSIDLRDIPGFGTMTGFLIFLLALMSLGYFLDRFRIVIFSSLPIIYLLLILVAIPLLGWYGWRRMAR